MIWRGIQPGVLLTLAALAMSIALNPLASRTKGVIVLCCAMVSMAALPSKRRPGVGKVSQKAAEHLPVFVVELERDGRITGANQAWLRCFPQAESLLDCCTSNEAADLTTELRSIMLDLPSRLELWMHSDAAGPLRRVEWMFAAMGDEPLSSISGVGIDVTVERSVDHESAILQRKLAEIARLQRAILDSTDLLIMATDEDGIIRSMNGAAATILGYQDHEIDGLLSIDAVAAGINPGDLPDRLAPKDNIARFSHQFITADGTLFPVDVTLAPLLDSTGCADGFLWVAEDVRARIEMERSLAREQATTEAILETAADAILSITSEGIIATANAAATRMFGFGRKKLEGRPFSDLVPNPGWRELRSRLHNPISNAPFAFSDTVAHTMSSHEIPIELTLAEIEGHEHGMYVAIARDVSMRKVIEAELERQVLELSETRLELELQQQELISLNLRLAELATRDGLTGLYNHRFFHERLSDEADLARAMDAPLAVILTDVDFFKQFNDTFGHPAGDEVLRRVALLISSVASADAIVARYGGEEFSILLPGYTEREAFHWGEKVRQCIEQFEWPQRNITVSVGVATAVGSAIQGEALVASADEALYNSKRNGRNCVTSWISSGRKAA